MKVMAVIGTRPEAIKMAPVVAGLSASPGVETTVIATAQHRELLDQVLDEFGIAVARDLDLMTEGQSLAGFAGRCLAGLDPVLRAVQPDVVLAQGDTTTTLMAALAAFYGGVPFAHLEAGLRTGDLGNPYPEEMNRRLVARIAGLHLAPTEEARQNLLREEVADADIEVCGNTVIDALFKVCAGGAKNGGSSGGRGPRILVTVHRRENLGEPLSRICRAVLRLVQEVPGLEAVWPVHPNPAVRGAIDALIPAHPRLHLVPPMTYGDFVRAMDGAQLILTDSGGVQEEAPALGKPVLVLRERTERPEVVAAGAALLVGSDEAGIVAAAKNLLGDPVVYGQMARQRLLYGDGHAAERAIAALLRRYGRAL